MQSEQLYLVLGCFGRRESDFIHCTSVSNRILNVKESLVYYDEIMDYFEAVRLFDKPMFDMNAVRRFVHNMQDRYDQKINRLWTEEEYQRYEKFIVGHKACGIYVHLVVSTEEMEDSHEESPKLGDTFIKANDISSVKQPNLTIVRGRRS